MYIECLLHLTDVFVGSFTPATASSFVLQPFNAVVREGVEPLVEIASPLRFIFATYLDSTLRMSIAHVRGAIYIRSTISWDE